MAEVIATLESGWLTTGPRVAAFERAFAEYTDARYAIALNSCTAALHLSLLASGVRAGDEVVTTPLTFCATANTIVHCGARPVFVDVDPATFNIDPTATAAAITPRTRALLPVHLYGRLCDMQPICEIARQRGLALIEDAAQAHGASLGGRHAGSFGTGCFSLYATKNLAAGEGGLISTDDQSLARRLRRLRSHGEDERYESVELGYNYRLTEIGAALALSQLDRLAEGNETRRRNAAYLSQHLQGVVLPEPPPEPAAHVWHQYTVRVPVGRDELRQHLQEHGIEARVYYPMTLPAQKLYRDLGYTEAAFPVARRLTREVLSPPVHPGLSASDLDQIVAAVNAWTAQHASRGAASR